MSTVRALLGGALVALLGTAPAHAAADAIALRARINPGTAKVGQRLRYEGVVRVPAGTQVRYERPVGDAGATWSGVRVGRVPGRGGAPDSVWFVADLQLFELGRVSVPGVGVRMAPAPDGAPAGRVRLPVVAVQVVTSLTPADSNADLRALHGPIAAPWWERVPWAWMVGLLAFVAGAIALVRYLRRRTLRPVAAPTIAPVRTRVDPAAEALRALALLRARELPAQERFSDHALELTSILRRFLEATVMSPRPGDTSAELIDRLRASQVPPEDLERLEGLLALWDRVKFARAPFTLAGAQRAEEAVEAHVRAAQQARASAEERARAAAAQLAAVRPTPPDPAGAA
ncbi:MAG: DUF4129 domain-containing protein [bacterium]